MEYGFNKELYPTQRKIISDVSDAINKKQKLIVSSPTGTGKTLALLSALSNYLKKPSYDDDLFELFNSKTKTKIYYCSRTHSQLSQVMRELKECKYKYDSVILGSRKMYCLNPEVIKFTNIDLINDKCKELVRSDCCPFYKPQYFSQTAHDIEELKGMGRKECFCPYYVAKNKASDCEIVFLPYNLLFTKEGRESSNIDLKDKVVIIDEAHNIVETIIQLNSAEITWNEINQISLARFLDKDMVEIILKLKEYRLKIKNQKALKIIDFLVDSKLSSFNMLDVSDEIDRKKIAQKNDLKCVFEFSKFLRFLTFSDEFGRIYLDSSKIKFSCVDPKMYFAELNQCSSVIFAGGTMEPINHLQNIFPDIFYQTYPSVNTNFVSLVISKTVNQKLINFTFSNRNNQIDDIINTLVAITNPIITGGIIIFVPSAQVLQLLKNSQKINNFRRKFWFEDEIKFTEFSLKPSILFAVMGGSLSEGINFSDDLCRLLIVLGVPYPTKTLEIEEKSKILKDYEINIAMKTVNQTVGRAIRHKNDYAAIVLLDSRFEQLRTKLSPWLAKKTHSIDTGKGIATINSFLKTQLASNI